MKKTVCTTGVEQGKASVSRRSFIAGTGILAAGTAAGMLVGCSSNGAGSEGESTTEGQSSSDVAWDKEADVVVAGTGTVIYAAIACDTMAAGTIIVLEKDAAMFGGTSAMSGGGYALPINDWYADEGLNDTRDAELTYMAEVGDGRLDADVQASFVDNTNEFLHWTLDTFGWTKWGHYQKAFGDYYELYPDSIANGYGRGSWNPYTDDTTYLMGSDQWAIFKEYVDGSDNIELIMGTSVNSLITDSSGAVIGITTSNGENIKAGSVVLGTGGFDHDADQRRFHIPYPLQRSCASPNNTGDGQKMSARIGAQLSYMDGCFGLPFVYGNATYSKDDFAHDVANADWYSFRGLPHSIVVNHKGRRFGDETSMYDTMLRAYGTYDTGTQEYVNVPGYWICDSQYASQYVMPGYTTVDALPDYVFSANTLGELADMMGIDAAGLEDEVATFNANAANGEDPIWHRDKPNSLATAAQMGLSLSLTGTAPTTILGTVEQPPFYCCREVPGTTSTNGGMRINANAQVLDVDGDAIPGLYAVGTCACTVADYWAGGATLSQGAVMSYVAAKHITS